MAPASFTQNSKTVCVMDASGSLGSTLVERLLYKGYTVHAAVQNHGELQCFEGEHYDNKKLRVFHSDPLDYHSIMDALKGCSGLFYSFEPSSDQLTYDEFMAEVEVRAAHNVLEACARTDTIDKVVFTSSATAVIWRDDRNTMSSDIDERHWSDTNLCRKFKLWHALSKTLAEKTAWALAMDRGVNMVSINGGFLMAPPHLTIKNPYLKGAAEMYEDGVFVTVDLNFIVDSHICIFENVSSYGRYLCFNHVISCNKDATKLAHILLPPSEACSPERLEDTRVYQQRISSKKLNKLMMDFES
ncbi:hypothetical protein RGQ29_030588 [Quercus rubra]|uniref:NAD-dependent epimerase/dehydratase domain-containing protein n=1 Tax=Quercus rubra TaxID=3512 RepID=A0AAN7EIC5_QUERU|nr:hypothetical protein RGQ29_030588 [Quercus rubra]